jgi:predicted transcriptional regulator
MARPKAKELTERELEIMHAFWDSGEMSIADLQQALAERGRELAYTTVATLVKILHEKGYLKQTNTARPFRYRPLKSFREVSGKLLKDVMQRVFGGSREALLVRLMEQKELTAKEREVLQRLIQDKRPSGSADAE